MTRDPKDRKEWQDQVDLVRWAKAKVNACPALAMLHHVPNGEHRNKAVAGKLRALGVKAGVPDLCLPVPTPDYHGLYLELKRWPKPARVSPPQRWWIKLLRGQGYQVVVCHGWGEGADCLAEYLSLREHQTEKELERRNTIYRRCIRRAVQEAAKCQK